MCSPKACTNWGPSAQMSAPESGETSKWASPYGLSACLDVYLWCGVEWEILNVRESGWQQIVQGDARRASLWEWGICLGLYSGCLASNSSIMAPSSTVLTFYGECRTVLSSPIMVVISASRTDSSRLGRRGRCCSYKVNGYLFLLYCLSWFLCRFEAIAFGNSLIKC